MKAEVTTLELRAAIHSALGDAGRLAIVDALALADASPGELSELLNMPSNLLAHHLHVLEKAGIVRRVRSEADRRRTYVRLVPSRLGGLIPPAVLPAPRIVFVCTHNSARSQLAVAMWPQRNAVPAASAGIDPSGRVHQRAIGAARRHGLTIDPRGTAHVGEVIKPTDVVVTVCDNAYEKLKRQRRCLHWSVPDPVRADTDEAFEAAFADIEARIGCLAAAVVADSPDQEDSHG